jgi:hypothetical protein
LVLASVSSSGSAATASDPAPDAITGLVASSEGWTVHGASASRGEAHVTLTPAAGTAEIPVGPGERLYATTPAGRLVGQLNGATADPNSTISPLSFVFRPDGDLLVGWRPVEGADVYEVSVNDTLVARLSSLSIQLASSSVQADDLVTVTAISSSAPDDPQVIGVMSLLVSAFRDAEDHPGRSPSRSSSDVQAASLPSYTGFIFRSFIPDLWVEAPLLCDGQGLWPNDRYFRGDNRGFSSSSTAFRTQATVTLRWTQSSDLTSKGVGTTRLYKKNTNGTYSFLESKTASTAGITFYGPNTYSPTRKNFISYTSVANPFCSWIFNAAIDLTVNGVVDRTAGYTGFNVWGTHDRAPNYELYFYNEGTTTTRFHGWNRGDFRCLSPYVYADPVQHRPVTPRD